MGKSDGLEGHAVASAKVATLVLERIQMPESDRRTCAVLIEHHLDFQP
jgi:UTP:GlnB (protein PII) uridylyltransferase